LLRQIATWIDDEVGALRSWQSQCDMEKISELLEEWPVDDKGKNEQRIICICDEFKVGELRNE
jgi:hypothetical protein